MSDKLTDQLLQLRLTAEYSLRKGYKTPQFRDAMSPGLVMAMIDCLSESRVYGGIYGLEAPNDEKEKVLLQALEAVNG